MDLNELRRLRGVAIHAMRALLEKAETEKRELTAEENDQYGKAEAEEERLQKKIQREEKLAAREAELARVPESERAQRPEPGREDRGGDRGDAETAEARMAAFRRFLTGGLGALSEPERRALQADSDAAGGYTVPPEQFVNDLIKAIDDAVVIRPLANVSRLTMSASAGRPELRNDPADADWTSELATGNEDSTMDFGKRELTPSPLAKRIKISNKLLRISAQPIEQLVRQRLAYKFGITEEKAFMTGHGAGQPLGVFTASANGISTGRDVSTGNSTTEIGADNLIECKYTLKTGYWPQARWVFHRDAVKRIRKLKDGEGQYLWQPGLQAGSADRIIDTPFLMSEYAPNTFTTGKYVGLIGAFSHYWIVEALTMTVQRLVELYAETNQTGFIGRMELDGAPVLEEAFVRAKLA